MSQVQRIICTFCSKSYIFFNYKTHEERCSSNPKNLGKCPVCQKEYYLGRKSRKLITCSRSCAKRLYHSKYEAMDYVSICFRFHEKKCVICEERKIVAVHHFDEDRTNNSPENLVPLCPTHHSYVHSRYCLEVSSQIIEYVKNWKLRNVTA